MRIALVRHLPGRHDVPGRGQGDGPLLERLGHEVVFPAGQTCCGQMHINTGYQKDALPLVRRHVRDLRAVRRGRRAVRVVRRVGAAPARDGRVGGGRRPGWPPGPRTSRRAPTSCPSCSSTCSGWRTSARTTRTGSPTTRPATRCGCCGSATSRCGCCATSRGLDLVELPGGRAVLRVRRHVRGEERGHLDGDAGRQDRARARDRRRGLHGRRRVLPDAHRRRPVPAARPGVRTVHLAEILAATTR